MNDHMLVAQSTDSYPDTDLYEVNISNITALTEDETRQILALLKAWGYQWDDELVCWGGFEMDAETLR